MGGHEYLLVQHPPSHAVGCHKQKCNFLEGLEMTRQEAGIYTSTEARALLIRPQVSLPAQLLG